jgi:hypothetical protein
MWLRFKCLHVVSFMPNFSLPSTFFDAFTLGTNAINRTISVYIAGLALKQLNRDKFTRAAMPNL